MKQENKHLLESLMEINRQKAEEVRKLQNRKIEEDDRFLKEFERVKKEIISPVMEDVGRQLERYGHVCDIVLQEEIQDQDGKIRNASIALYIFPEGKRGWRFDSIPSVVFYGIKFSRKVWIHRSTMVPAQGGAVGAVGEFSLEELSSDFVEHKIMDCLQDIFV